MEPFKLTMAEVEWSYQMQDGTVLPIGHVHLDALDSEGNPTNKTRQNLHGFLSRETKRVLQRFRDKAEPEEPVFLGMSSDNSYYHIMQALKTLQLTSRHGYLNKFTVHPHTFRSMNLAIAKRSGFDPDWAEALAGHNVGVKISYDILDEMAESWLEKVEPNMVFLSDAKPRTEE